MPADDTVARVGTVLTPLMLITEYRLRCPLLIGRWLPFIDSPRQRPCWFSHIPLLSGLRPCRSILHGLFLRRLRVLLLDALRNVRQTLLDLFLHLLNDLFPLIRQGSVVFQRVCATPIDFNELFLPKDLLLWDQPGTSGKVTLCRFVIAGRI